MIDYWEALGRLACDKGLFDQFKEVLGPPSPQYLPSETVTVNHVTATVLKLPEDAYKSVQGFLSPILTEHYVSVFVAGELIWTFSQDKSRKAFAGLHASISKAKPDCPSTSYFIALGLLLVDKIFRAEVAKGGKNRVEVLPRLSDLERDHVGALMEDDDFLRSVGDFEDIWDEGCFDWLFWEAGYVHPLAVNTKQKTVGAKSGLY
jgi:hypothetical protein